MTIYLRVRLSVTLLHFIVLLFCADFSGTSAWTMWPMGIPFSGNGALHLSGLNGWYEPPSWPSDNQPKWPYDNQPKWPYDNQPKWPYDNQPKWPSDNQPKWPSDNQPKWPSDNGGMDEFPYKNFRSSFMAQFKNESTKTITSSNSTSLNEQHVIKQDTKKGDGSRQNVATYNATNVNTIKNNTEFQMTAVNEVREGIAYADDDTNRSMNSLGNEFGNTNGAPETPFTSQNVATYNAANVVREGIAYADDDTNRSMNSLGNQLGNRNGTSGTASEPEQLGKSNAAHVDNTNSSTDPTMTTGHSTNAVDDSASDTKNETASVNNTQHTTSEPNTNFGMTNRSVVDAKENDDSSTRNEGRDNIAHVEDNSKGSSASSKNEVGHRNMTNGNGERKKHEKFNDNSNRSGGSSRVEAENMTSADHMSRDSINSSTDPTMPAENAMEENITKARDDLKSPQNISQTEVANTNDLQDKSSSTSTTEKPVSTSVAEQASFQSSTTRKSILPPNDPNTTSEPEIFPTSTADYWTTTNAPNYLSRSTDKMLMMAGRSLSDDTWDEVNSEILNTQAESSTNDNDRPLHDIMPETAFASTAGYGTFITNNNNLQNEDTKRSEQSSGKERKGKGTMLAGRSLSDETKNEGSSVTSTTSTEMLTTSTETSTSGKAGDYTRRTSTTKHNINTGKVNPFADNSPSDDSTYGDNSTSYKHSKDLSTKDSRYLQPSTVDEAGASTQSKDMMVLKPGESTTTKKPGNMTDNKNVTKPDPQTQRNLGHSTSGNKTVKNARYGNKVASGNRQSFQRAHISTDAMQVASLKL